MSHSEQEDPKKPTAKKAETLKEYIRRVNAEDKRDPGAKVSCSKEDEITHWDVRDTANKVAIHHQIATSDYAYDHLPSQPGTHTVPDGLSCKTTLKSTHGTMEIESDPKGRNAIRFNGPDMKPFIYEQSDPIIARAVTHAVQRALIDGKLTKRESQQLVDLGDAVANAFHNNKTISKTLRTDLIQQASFIAPEENKNLPQLKVEVRVEKIER